MHLNLENLAQGTSGLNQQLLEDTLYEVALTELKNEIPEKVTMSRALSEARGDIQQAALQYPKLRVIRLKAELKQYKKETRSITAKRSLARIKFEISDLINDIFGLTGPNEKAQKNKKTSFDDAFLWDED
jgi:hypothetical protein